MSYLDELMMRNASSKSPFSSQFNTGSMMPSIDQLPVLDPYLNGDTSALFGDFGMPSNIGNFDAVSGVGAATKPGMFGGLFDGFLTKKDGMTGDTTMGWGNALLDLGKAGMQGYLGLQQLGVAKDNLQFQKDAFSKQFENQRSLTNTEMQDRQNARNAASPGQYQDTATYMKQHGV